MSKLFFDFEFDNADLISFGIVSDSDHEMYTEFVHPTKGFSSHFVHDTILPLLTKPVEQRKSLAEWSRALGTFADMFADRLFICDSDMDKAILQRHLPLATIETIEFSDYDEETIFNKAYNKAFDPVLTPRHHALNDAKAIMAGYQALNAHRETVKKRSWQFNG